MIYLKIFCGLTVLLGCNDHRKIDPYLLVERVYGIELLKKDYKLLKDFRDYVGIDNEGSSMMTFQTSPEVANNLINKLGFIQIHPNRHIIDEDNQQSDRALENFVIDGVQFDKSKTYLKVYQAHGSI